MAGTDGTDGHLPTVGTLRWLLRGYEAFVFVVALGPILNDLLSPSAAPSLYFYAGVVLAATLLGWAVGGVVRSFAVGVVGRANAATVSLLGYAIVAGLTAASGTFLVFASLRLLAGAFVGLGGEPTSASATADGRRTGTASAGFGGGIVLTSVAWAVLQLFEPGFLASTIGPEPWRYLFVVGVVPVLAIPLVRRSARAVPATDGSTNGPSEGFDGSHRRRTAVAVAAAFGALAGWWGVVAWLPTYAGVVAEGYGLANPDHWAAVAGACYGVGAIGGALTADRITERIGRVGSSLVVVIGAFATAFALFVLVHTPLLFAAVAAVVGYFTGGQFGWLAAFLPTLVPGESGLETVWALARLAAVPLPLLIGYEITVFDGIDTVVAAGVGVYAVGILAACYLPERTTPTTDSRPGATPAETNGPPDGC